MNGVMSINRLPKGNASLMPIPFNFRVRHKTVGK